MNNELMADFTIDKAEKKVTIKREFVAPKENVWAAWTDPRLLDQWWAPKPWKSETKLMNFTEGGRRLYAMVSPEGEKHWSLIKYTSITPEKNLKCHDSFSDSEGNINKDMPQSDWNVNFVESEDLTTVNIEIQHEELSDLETIIEMGFKEGMTATLEELAKVLTAKNNS